MTQQECNIDKIIKYLSELQTELQTQLSAPSKKATVNIDKQPSKRIEEKRSSWWVWIREIVKKSGKVKKEASNHGSDSGDSQGGSRRIMQNIDEDQEDADLAIRKLQSDILQMITAFRNLTEFQTNMSKSLELDLRSTKLRAILHKKDSIRSRSHDLKEIRRKVFTLKCQIPSLLHKESARGISITDAQTAEEINETGNDIYLPGLHMSGDFKNSLAFEEVVEKFQSLDFHQKLCLLSFAVFPENREVERTMLMYWWIGEGFIKCDESENSVTSILDEFSTRGLLEPVQDERKLKPSSYKMVPHVHSAVIYLAKYVDLFELSSHGKLIMEKSSKGKVCLVKGSSLLPMAKASAMKPQTLQTVFNSSERYPDFTFKWFPFMNSLRVLYLGRWERTAKRHIEVESTEFLKNMKTLKNLRLASFQGISRIEKLENSICALRELVILDLKACYNLEVLPSDIGLFEKLIYLDVSECYMLDRMPKGIAKLSRLQVLKGFVISESDHENNCAVKHLVNLRKLSITVNKRSFKVESLTKSLTGLKQLESLKIAWGASFREDDDQRGEKSEETNEADESRETTNEGKENQGGPETEKKLKDLMERDDDQVQKKGQTSKEKKGDIEETGKREDGVSRKKGDGRSEEANLEEGKKHNDQVQKKGQTSGEDKGDIEETGEPEDGVSRKKGDGRSEEANLEEGKKHDDQVQKKGQTSGENKGDIEETGKPEDGVSSKKGDGRSEEANPEEGKKHDDQVQKKGQTSGENKGDIEETGKPEDGVSSKKGDGRSEEANPEEGKKHDDQVQKKGQTSGENKGDIEETGKPEDGVSSKKGDGRNEEANLEEGKKHDEAKAESLKSDKVVEEENKTSPSQEATETIQNKPDNQKGKNKVEEEGDANKGKADLEEGKKQDEAEKSKSEVVKGEKKDSPPRESSDMIQKKPDDESKVEKERDGDKGKADLDEGKKRDDVEATNSNSDKVVEGDEKTSPPQESKDTIQNKTGDKNKVENEGDGDKGKADPEEGKKHDEIEAASGAEGVNKASPSRESTDAIQNKPDDHQRGEKQEEKGDGEKKKVNLEEGKKHDEVKAESSKPDKAIEGDEKKNPPLESKDTIQSKPDEHREISKVQEKGDGVKNGDDLKKLDGGEAKTHKSHKTIKFGISEKSKPLFQKKPGDLKKDNAMAEEIHETASPSRKSRFSKEKLFMALGNQTKKWRWQENQAIDDTAKLPSSLKKLELECFPDENPPSWLNPQDLKNLEKLSIRGGNLTRISDESQNAEDQWPVQILRLKYLHEFKVEWRDLRALFPKMTLLEKYKCPKISFCPTDGYGVWRSQPQTSPNM